LGCIRQSKELKVMHNKQPSGFIRADDMVSVKELHNELEIQKFIPRAKSKKVRFSRFAHLDTETGEIISDNLSTYRGESPQNLRQSVKKLQDIIKLNTVCTAKTLVLTLTYAQKQYCANKAQYDFELFIARLRRKQKEFGAIEYISMREYHADFSYHIHALLYFTQTARRVFIDTMLVNTLWGHGAITVQQPKFKEQVFNYFTPHLVSAQNKADSKIHIKAMRLYGLSSNQKLYQCSKGILRPKRVKKKYAEALQEIEQKGYKFIKDFKYPCPIKNKKGNRIFHVREHYQKPQRNKVL